MLFFIVTCFFFFFFFFQAEDGIRDHCVTGVQTCALPIWPSASRPPSTRRGRAPRRSSRSIGRRWTAVCASGATHRRGSQSSRSGRLGRRPAPEEHARDRVPGQGLLRRLHIEVEDRRDVEGEELGDQPPADYGQPE